MKRITKMGVAGILACSLLAAYAGPKDDIHAAARKLAHTSYSWTTTIDLGPNSNFTPGPTEGKHAADGTTYVSREFNGNTIEFYHKGRTTVVSRDGQLRAFTAGQSRGGQGNAQRRRGRFMFFGAQAPTAELQRVLRQTGDFTESDGALVADLTQSGATRLLTFRGRRPGGEAPPAPKNAKGSLKVWLKDGNLSKYTLNLQGTVTFNGEERDINRTTTVEFKNVGATELKVPQEVKDKLQS